MSAALTHVMIVVVSDTTLKIVSLLRQSRVEIEHYSVENCIHWEKVKSQRSLYYRSSGVGEGMMG